MPGSASVFWHSSEDMHEVKDQSVKLLMGAGVFLGDGVTWDHYQELYHQVFVINGLRVMRDDAYLVTMQTDFYKDRRVFPRNIMLNKHLIKHFDLLDIRIWRRAKADRRHILLPNNN